MSGYLRILSTRAVRWADKLETTSKNLPAGSNSALGYQYAVSKLRSHAKDYDKDVDDFLAFTKKSPRDYNVGNAVTFFKFAIVGITSFWMGGAFGAGRWDGPITDDAYEKHHH